MKKFLKVLLVEDNLDDEIFVTRAISKEGYRLSYKRVQSAEEMKNALSSETWDIVISDYSLPNFSGEEALKILRERDLVLPFILVSGAVGEDVAVLMMRNGANDYIMKQNLKRLGATIERELADAATKRNEKAAQEEIKQLSLVAKHTSNQVVITDAGGFIEWVNDAFVNTTGYTLPEVIGKKPGNVLQGEATNSETVAYMRAQINKQERFNCEIINYAKSGEQYWITIHAEPIFNEKGELTKFIAIQRNITRQKQHEAELKRINLELEDRVAARTQELNNANKDLEAFNFTVSHDLRTPVHFTNKLLDSLMSKYVLILPDGAKDILQEIKKSNIKLSNRINDLLAFSLMGKREKRNNFFNVEELFRYVFEEQKKVNPNINTQFIIHKLPQAYGDRVMLQHVIQNLLTNAIKFSAKNPDSKIEISGTETDTETIYCVCDNGVGFDMKYYNKLFETFQRLHQESEFEGTGAGLAIAQRIVLRHGGRIWANSELGKGSTFYFSLPKC